MSLILLMFAVALVETVLSLTWNRPYFLLGVPIFRREVLSTGGVGPLPTPDQLKQGLSRSVFPVIGFRVLDDSRYAFREVRGGGLRFGYTPVMRGVLLFDRANHKVVVLGMLNWFTLVFTVAFIAVARPMNDTWLGNAFLVVILATIYWMQHRRFVQVSKAALALWEGRPVR